MKAAAGVLMLLAGCGAPRSYMGLDLTGPVGSMPDGLARLIALAYRAGDQRCAYRCLIRHRATRPVLQE